MQHSFYVCVIIAACSLVGSPQKAEECSPGLVGQFYLSTVEGALKVGQEGVAIATYDKMLAQLGDNGAMAILKLVDPKELLEPRKTKACLYVIWGAFSNPKMIAGDMNKNPRVTLFLLDYLYEKENDPELKKEIEKTKDYVETHTGLSTR